MEASQSPMDDDQIREIDAAYRPVPKFADWPQEPDRPDLWAASAAELDSLRESASSEEMERALRVVARTAAIETGAIEGLYDTDRGLTITVATQAAMWEGALAEEEDRLALFEAQLRAYDLVLDAATANTPISEAFIRRLHEVLTAPQDTYTVVTSQGLQAQTLPKGEYKRHPNHVRTADGSIHAYAPVDMTVPEMARFVENLNASGFAGAHPVLQASYAHYVLAAIHPFADGNGRVARALSSIYFYRAVGIPVLILSDQREEYFRALAQADEADYGPFVALIAEAGRSALAMVVSTLQAGLSSEPEVTLSQFRQLFDAQGGLTFHELDAVAAKVPSRLAELAQERIAQLVLPTGVRIGPQLGHGRSPSRMHGEGFRAIVTPGPMNFQLDFTAPAPAEARVTIFYNILVSTDRDTSLTVRIEDEETGDGMTFALRDLHPTITIAADYRLRAFVESAVSTGLERLYESSARALDMTPYGRPPETP